MKLFTIYKSINREQLIEHFSFEKLKELKFEIVEDRTLRKLDDCLKSNKKLNVDSIMKSNRPIGALFSII